MKYINGKRQFKSLTKADKQRIMWDAWGGTSGIEWAINKLKQIDKK